MSMFQRQIRQHFGHVSYSYHTYLTGATAGVKLKSQLTKVLKILIYVL